MSFRKFLFLIVIMTTALCASAANPKKSSFFFAYNETDRVVTISVGNFFPTQYQIDPHSYRTVFVSTDNQNIHILS